ncbi:MAG: CBS domain-containing protein [Lewinellaceae bacterium]|nr:CBS domain-containing protein [Lewinellaceae bacterium]
MENTIATRIADFLKEYPPFSLLDRAVLDQLANRALVQYMEAGQAVFREGEQPPKQIYIVRQGAINLFKGSNETGQWIDSCDEGDVFGLRPLLADEPYALTAIAAEESLLYAIPIAGLEKSFLEHPKVSYYLLTNFAAGMSSRYSLVKKGRFFQERTPIPGEPFELVEIQSIDRSKEPITCPPDMPIREAAGIMSQKNVGSIILVNADNHPLGIATDKDFRRKVVTGKHNIDEPISNIMSSPVLTIRPDVTIADVQIRMIKHRVHHLCVTEDGTTNSRALGVISEHDLLVLQGNNPANLLREVRISQKSGELRAIREKAESLLRSYILQEVAINYITAVISEINDAIIVRALELSQARLAEQQLAPPEVPFCWLALGSEGRSEQLLRTDQDNALVFADVPKKKYAEVKAWYLKLAEYTTQVLNEVGFEYCPAKMMASNPKWCLSLSEWKQQFSSWIQTPDPKSVMLSTIFFDYRPVFGEKWLAEELTAHIFSQVDRHALFLSLLAKNALQSPPPLSFFRGIMLERSGEHKDEFDIKKRAMMPLTDAARTLVLANKVAKVNNTFRRFDRLAELEPKNAELFQQAADAYEILIRFRTLEGLKNKDSGRFFKPENLSKMERLMLRNCFEPISQLQTLLTTRFQLNFIR